MPSPTWLKRNISIKIYQICFQTYVVRFASAAATGVGTSGKVGFGAAATKAAESARRTATDLKSILKELSCLGCLGCMDGFLDFFEEIDV